MANIAIASREQIPRLSRGARGRWARRQSGCFIIRFTPFLNSHTPTRSLLGEWFSDLTSLLSRFKENLRFSYPFVAKMEYSVATNPVSSVHKSEILVFPN